MTIAARFRAGSPVRGSLKPQALHHSFMLSAKADCAVFMDFATLCGYPATRPQSGCGRRRARKILSSPSDNNLREQGTRLMPKFDGNGLLTAVAVDHTTGGLLMLAHMDQEALDKTLETGFAHFHSRSRGRLWMKGESSGHVLRIVEIRVDCDQDALELRVEPAGPACHTMAQTCFYRRITSSGELERIAD
jgi:phosphoribosyl-AMP cyclohydrolase